MISTFWFLIKIGLLTMAVLWLTALDGAISIDFQSYRLSTSLSVFLILSFVIIWVFSIVLRALNLILHAPQTIIRYHDRQAQKKGLQALAYGLSAVAAGDIRMATYYTKRTHRYLKNDFGLGHLLDGLTAKLSGDDQQVQTSFEKLLDVKETSIIGLKGLLHTALDKGDLRYARVLIEKTHAHHSKHEWILRAYYDLEMRCENYDVALALLKKMRKRDLISKEKERSDRACLLMMTGKVDKAYKLSPSSLPIGLAYLKNLTENKKRRKSINIIKKLWNKTPHPRLMDYWIAHAPSKTIDNPHAMTSWIESLYLLNSDSASSALYCGEALIRIGQKDDAKRFIKNAIALKPTIRTYQFMHQIDPRGDWIDHVATANHDECWICTKTQTIYAQWHALSDSQYFNTVTWAYPSEVKRDAISKRTDIEPLALSNLF